MRSVEVVKGLIVGFWSVASVFVGVSFLAYWFGSLVGEGLLFAGLALASLGSFGMGRASIKMSKNQPSR